jgi:DnaA family protein
MKQIPLAIGPDAPSTFDSFVVGANVAAVRQLRALELGAPPVYLWGPPGCGKTHLLHALAHERRSHGERIGWFGARDGLPWTFDAAWSLVVLDDCDAYDAARQQAAFALFVEAGTHAVQLAASGKGPPTDLPVRDDLRTRLGWGHVFALQPLSEGEARATLRREADRRGIFLSDDVMDHLLTRFARDLKHLMALLDRLDAYALARQRAVTVPLIRQMLADEGQGL